MRVKPKGADQTENAPPLAAVYETGGEVFEDGTLIEPIEDWQQLGGLSLLKYDGCEPVVSPRVVHRDRTYIPLKLNSTVRAALRFPCQLAPYVSIKTLTDELLTLTSRYTDLAEHVRQRLVATIYASWIPDLLPSPVNVWLWSPSSAVGARILELLQCCCRQPLLLTGVDVADLKALPDCLPATKLILRPASGRSMLDWLAASGWQNFHHVRCGRLVRTVGAKVIAAETPVGKFGLGSFVEIPIISSRQALPPLDAKSQREIADEFLPKLLQFRLDCCGGGKFAGSGDVDSGGPEGAIASSLGGGLADSPELKEHLALLMETEPDLSDRRLNDPRVALVEVLLLRCHEQDRDELYVAEIAADVNAVLDAEGARFPLSARHVGSLLKDLGLFTHRLGQSGRGLNLDLATRRAIHRLADTYNVQCAKQQFRGCTECTDI